jgi:hypothetical protein
MIRGHMATGLFIGLNRILYKVCGTRAFRSEQRNYKATSETKTREPFPS